MKVDYRRHMKKSGYTIEATAMDLDLSVRHVTRYLKGEAPVPDDKALELAHLYDAVELPFEQLGKVNPIGRKLCPAPLNNIDRSFTTLYYKSIEEQAEMNDALDEMCRMTLNGRLLDDEESFDQLVSQVIDVEQICLEIKIAYATVRGLEALEERMDEHRQKCINRGYYREKERPALIRERVCKIYNYRNYTTDKEADKDKFCQNCGAPLEIVEEPAETLALVAGSIVERPFMYSFLACTARCNPNDDKPRVYTDEPIPF